MAKNASPNALVTVTPGDNLPALLEARALEYAQRSRAPKTLHDYASHWRQFQGWCDTHKQKAMPASVKTLCGYAVELADAGRAVSTISCRLAAIAYVHQQQGHPVDLKHRDLKVVMGGVRRTLALKRTPRKARALTFDILRDILESLRPEVVQEAQDAAVLALGCVAGRRRSEITGIDWAQLGTSDDDRRLGVLMPDSHGLVLRLMKSKASQDTMQEVVIPREMAPILVRTIENWIKVGKVKPGQPLFRGMRGRWSENPQSPYRGVTWVPNRKACWHAQARVDGKQLHLGYFADDREAHLAYCKATGRKPMRPNEDCRFEERMHGYTITRIVQRRIRAWNKSRNKRGLRRLTREDEDQIVKEFTGHSMRAGCVTSMAEAGVPDHAIGQITLQTAKTIAGYKRPVDARKNWGLKGIAF